MNFAVDAQPSIPAQAAPQTSQSIVDWHQDRGKQAGDQNDEKSYQGIHIQEAGILLHHALLGNSDIVAAGVFHHIHHLVGLTDDFVRALRVFGIAGHAHAGSDIEWDVFDIERGRTHHVAQTFGDDHCRVLVGLRQQDHELIAAITKGIVDQAQVGFDFEADLGKQLASDEVSVSVVHLLEVIEVNEQYAELISKAVGAIDLGFQRFVEVAGVVEAGAVVGDRQFLNLLDRARIIYGDGGVVAKGMEKEHFIVSKALHGAVN